MIALPIELWMGEKIEKLTEKCVDKSELKYDRDEGNMVRIEEYYAKAATLEWIHIAQTKNGEVEY